MSHQRGSVQPPNRRAGAAGDATEAAARPSLTPADAAPSRRPTRPANLPSSSTPAAAAAAPQRSRSPVFWGARQDAALFRGPLGEPVGGVSQGTVLLEHSRYRDAFGGWWISTRCGDGTLGWISYSEGAASHSEADEGETATTTAESSLWQRVYDSRATPAPAATAAGQVAADSGSSDARAQLPDTAVPVSSSSPLIPAASIAALQSQHFLFQDSIFFEYYWASVGDRAAHRDWNADYQRAVEALRIAPELLSTECEHKSSTGSGTMTDSHQAAESELSALLAEFRTAAVDAVLRVCEEAVMPVQQRTVHCHPAHPNEVFFSNGILLKRCVDTADGALGGDDAAAKLAAVMFRNNELVALHSVSHFLSTPLQARCVFGGYSFLCSAIPPYDEGTLIYAHAGTVDSQANGVSAPPVVLDLLRGLGQSLSLEEGELPWEWRVYAGRDRRLYLSQTHRLLPPVLPLSASRGAAGKADSATPSGPAAEPASAGTLRERVRRWSDDASAYASLVRSHIRPEVFATWPSKWRPNECCCPSSEKDQCSMDERSETARSSPSTAVGQWIKSDGITRVAAILGFLAPLAVPLVAAAECSACGNTMDGNELRFVVCDSPSACCRICVHCYTSLIFEDSRDTDRNGSSSGSATTDERLSRTCSSVLQCSDSSSNTTASGGLRKAGSFLLEPPLTTILHAHGLNVRYLPYVLHRLPQPSRAAVEHWLQVELVARAAKYVLLQDLRRTTTAAEARETAATVLSALLQPTGAVSERFWRTRLGPVLQSHFSGICEPFQVSVYALRAVAERVQALTGVWLTTASLRSLGLLAASSHGAPQAPTSAETEKEGASMPFVEIDAITPRVWVFGVPLARLVSTAARGSDEGALHDVSPLRRRLEAMLLFWIGHTPDNADDAQQPFYLEESMFGTPS